jgi:hypothetical protein
VNTGDFVEAATADASDAGGKSAARHAPMFFVARDDLVRIFVDCIEPYAPYVREGTKATVRVDALSGLEINATVTRTSWSVGTRTRSLWVEIDLPIKSLGLSDKQIALAAKGNDMYCYLLKDAKAVKTAVAKGLRDGPWVEVTKLKVGGQWLNVTGQEQVIVGELSELSDGQEVEVVETPAPESP